jgi:hypothetical protein
MELTAIAASVAALITPFLPVLKKVAGKSLEEIGKQTGGALFDYANRIWVRIFPKIENKEVVATLQKDPEQEKDLESYKTIVLPRNQEILKNLIEEIGRKDSQLIDELRSLLQEAENENGGQPFNKEYSMRIGSQVAKNMTNIGNIQTATFNQS